MQRDDIKAIALAFVDRLLTDAALRDETRRAAAMADPHENLARVVTQSLNLSPPFPVEQIKELGSELSALYAHMQGLYYPIAICDYYIGRGVPPTPPGD